jgi:hypothetical protein
MRNTLLFALGTCCASAALAAPLTTADLVGILLAGLSVGEPLRAGGLAVFPLSARDPLREPVTRIVTIGEALERAWLTLRVSTVDDSPCILVQSWADAAILITAGEELPGCGGLRAARDVLAPPGARGLAVPGTPALAPSAGDERAWQRRVRALATLAAAFPGDCEGVLLAVGRSVRLELFPSAWLLSRARADLLKAAAFEALSSTDGVAMEREDAERFLRDVAGLPWERREPVGLGFEAGASEPPLTASVLFLGGALVHLSVSERPVPLLLEAPAADAGPAHP